MSFLATIRTSPIAGQNVTFTFPTGNIDTTNLITPGTPTTFDLRTYLFNRGIIRNLSITTNLKVIVPNGCVLGSSVGSRPVMRIANFKTRDSVTIINDGNIYGAGGVGGGNGAGPSGSGSTGGNGGDSLQIASYCYIINNGNISGGGGGGGGGKGGTLAGLSVSNSSGRTCGSSCPGYYRAGTTDSAGSWANPAILATAYCAGGYYSNCYGGCKCFNQTHYNCGTLNCPTTTNKSGGVGGAGQGAFTSAVVGGASGGGTATNGGTGGSLGLIGGRDSSNTILGGQPGYYISGISFVTLTGSGGRGGLVA